VSVECLRTEAERAAAVIAQGIGGIEDGGSAAPPEDLSSESLVESSASDNDLFKLGDQRWPVRVDVVSQFLQSDGNGVPGVAAKAHRLRKLAAKRLIVKDGGDIPETRVFSHQQCCGEAHPGLCADRDQNIYVEALALAKNFERCLHKELLHNVFMLIEDSDEGPHKQPVFIFFARVRARRLHMQVTHVVLECVPHPDGTLSCSQHKPRQWAFMSLWSLARQLLRDGWKNIQMTVMSCSTPGDDDAALGRFCPEDVVAEEVFRLWPGTFRRPRPPPRDNNGPDLGDRPVRRPRRPTGGVKANLPGAALVRAPPRARIVGEGHGDDAAGGVYYDLSDDDDMDGDASGEGDDGPDDAAPQPEVVHEHQ
jgi:hypothetical protein